MKHASPSLHNGEGATNPANQLIDLGRQKEGYQGNWRQKIVPSHLGIEPRTFGLEVQRAILCANGTPVGSVQTPSARLQNCCSPTVPASAVHILKLERYRED